MVPLTCLVLILLFSFQKRGTGSVGAVFGPVMVVWFLCLAVLGLRGIIGEPRVLAAVNPLHAMRFFRDNGWHGFIVLGSVFLVVTGGEALYADMRAVTGCLLVASAECARPRAQEGPTRPAH